MVRTIRRVVTSEDADGRSAVLADGPAACQADIVEGLRLSDIWLTDGSGDPLKPSEDVMAGRAVELSPPRAGTRFRVFELPPDSDYLEGASGEDLLGPIGAAGNLVVAQHPGMHRTDTVDYLVVLSGIVHLVLDSGEVELRAGDCVVQGGVNHAWSNRTLEPALVAAVLVAPA
jgi:mannose-6-phosphate isomerase-like protein (cupin superfamily)